MGLIEARNCLVLNEPVLIQDWVEPIISYYKEKLGSTSVIKTYGSVRPIFKEKHLLFYSGGAESLATKLMLVDQKIPFEQVTIDAFYPKAHRFLKDEWYYLEYALNHNASDAYLGIEKLIYTDEWCIEHTPEFLEHWNKFMPTQAHSLVNHLSKLEVYEYLLSKGVSIQHIKVDDGSLQKQSWKLFEKSVMCSILLNCKLDTKWKPYVELFYKRDPKAYPYLDSLVVADNVKPLSTLF